MSICMVGKHITIPITATVINHLCRIEYIVAVDPHSAGAQVARAAQSLADVTRANAGGEAVDGRVSAGDRFLDGLEFEDAHDGTEDLQWQRKSVEYFELLL